MRSVRSVILVAILLTSMAPWNPALAIGARDGDQAASDGACPDVPTNLIRNGSFEEPARGGVEFWTVPEGQHIGPWLVGGNPVDHIAVHWEAAHGAQSLDLNGCGPASVSQSVPTLPGASYELCFGMAGNTDGPPEVKRLEVIWDGNVAGTMKFDAGSKTRERMGWTYRRIVMRATAHDAVLAFHSLTPGCYGPVIDRVTLRLIQDPMAMR